MSLEIIAPPQSPSIPWIEGMLPGQEAQELAFTSKQRAWWLEAYNHQCHFPVYSDNGGFGKCYVKGDTNLQIHHILPSSWQSVWEPMQDPNDTIGIALCKNHHDNVIHPEMGDALRNYHNDPQSIYKALQWHRDMAQRGEKFWVTEYDEMMTERANKVIEQMKRPYPKDNSWDKKQHYPRKSWWAFI